jgi:hypothetical protein
VIIQSQLAVGAGDQDNAVTQVGVVRRDAGREERFVVGVRVNADESGGTCHDERLRGPQLNDSYDEQCPGDGQVGPVGHQENVART